ncbi:MAG: response regulator transcription factor [Chloroflexi bacterium]|nr:response regulator transcription factor [Chloroflexota bacterium]
MDTIRVLIADDHTLFRKGLSSILGQMQGIDIVGEASTGPEVIARARELVPDVVLMDIRMPGVNGIDATRQVLQENPQIGVILVTMSDDPESVFAGMRAGARGYVLKEAQPAELRRAIDAAYNGEILMNPAVAAKMLHRFDASTEPRPGGVPYEHLTPRELEVLKLAAQGMNNKEIAERLVLSEKTVKNHINSIFSKLQVNDRTRAIVQALKRGLIRVEPEDTAGI